MSGPKHLWSGDWERESADAARGRPAAPPAAAPAPADTPDDTSADATSGRRRGWVLAIGTATALVLVVAGVVLANVLGGGPAHPHHPPIASVPTRTQPLVAPGAGQTQTTPSGGSGLGAPTTPQAGSGGSQLGPGGSGGSGGQGGSQSAPGQTPPGGGQTNPSPSATPPPTSTVPQPTFTNQPAVNWLGMQIVTSPTGAVVNTVQIGSEGDTAGFEPGDMIAVVGGSQIGAARQIRAAVANVPVGSRVDVEIARGSTIINLAVTMRGRPTVHP